MSNWAVLSMGILCALTAQTEGTSAGSSNCKENSNMPAASSDANCMEHWYRISGATDRQIRDFGNRSLQAKFDEISIMNYEPYVLSLIIGYDIDLSKNVIRCMRRLTVCPVGGPITDFPCSRNGQCRHSNTTQSPICVCPQGLRGNRCHIDIDECINATLNNCANSTVADCFNFHGSFGCECHTGYVGSGHICTDVDECTIGSHSCHVNATCHNNAGSYSCQCEQGFYGDGRECNDDLCLTSSDAALCKEMQKMKISYKAMEVKMTEKDAYIERQAMSMELMASAVNRYEERISNMEERVQRNTDRSMSTQGELAEQCGVVSWKAFTQSRAQTSRASSSSLTWNAVFNKTREDTTLLITYTSTMGLTGG